MFPNEHTHTHTGNVHNRTLKWHLAGRAFANARQERQPPLRLIDFAKRPGQTTTTTRTRTIGATKAGPKALPAPLVEGARNTRDLAPRQLPKPGRPRAKVLARPTLLANRELGRQRARLGAAAAPAASWAPAALARPVKSTRADDFSARSYFQRARSLCARSLATFAKRLAPSRPAPAGFRSHSCGCGAF